MKKIIGLILPGCFMVACFMIVACFFTPLAMAQNKAPTLPNGANSLSEKYGLWSVDCLVQDNNKICSMSRQEVNDQNQPVISLSLVSAPNDGVSGLLIVPFGVLVSKPLSLRVDDTNSIVNAMVRTCMPAGCIVPVAFDKAGVGRLKAGNKLNLSITSASTGEPVMNDLYVQLSGFSAALARLIILSK